MEDGKKKDVYDIRPAAAPAAVAPTGLDWQDRDKDALAAATADGALAAFVADEAAARTLLGKVKGAYETDPLVATQIGAVTQWVMDRKTDRAAGRRIWVEALVKTAETSADPYVKEFCLDQLRWCGYDGPEMKARIGDIGRTSGDKAVRDFAAVVASELR